jgi:hypothetical protein
MTESTCCCQEGNRERKAQGACGDRGTESATIGLGAPDRDLEPVVPEVQVCDGEGALDLRAATAAGGSRDTAVPDRGRRRGSPCASASTRARKVSTRTGSFLRGSDSDGATDVLEDLRYLGGLRATPLRGGPSGDAGGTRRRGACRPGKIAIRALLDTHVIATGSYHFDRAIRRANPQENQGSVS